MLKSGDLGLVDPELPTELGGVVTSALSGPPALVASPPPHPLSADPTATAAVPARNLRRSICDFLIFTSAPNSSRDLALRKSSINTG
jgi:hypothetical protein